MPISQADMALKILELLDAHNVEYKLYEHRIAANYDDYDEIAKETGWEGTESKAAVMKAGEGFVVYFTVQGSRVDTKAMKAFTGSKKLRMATGEELEEKFGATPGNAYPFGFDADVPIVVDPQVYDHEWLLLSPCRPDQTVQVRGSQLRPVFESLPNQVDHISMNQG